MTREQLLLFGKLDRQLVSLSATIGKSVASKADEALGEFKLGLVARLLADLDGFLGEELQPFRDLAELAGDTTFGDADTILGQYRACLDEYQGRNTKKHYGRACWVVTKDGDGVEYVPVDE